MPRVEDNGIVESTTEARAAVTGHNVRYVLVISTLAAVVLFAVVYLLTRG
jgi:predicted secreted protein